MADIAKAAGSGRADIIPGKIVSAPRFKQIGMAEEEFAARTVRRWERYTRDLERPVRTDLMRGLYEKIDRGAYQYGEPDFNAAALSGSGISFLLWLSLTVEHPQTTQDEAESYLDSDDGKGIRGKAWDLWGFRPSEKKPPSDRANWRAILKRIVLPPPQGLGKSLAEFADMTIDQLEMILGDHDVNNGTPLTPDEQAAKIKADRVAYFDAVAARLNLTPQKLAELPAPQLASELAREYGKPVAPTQLPPLIAEYLAAKSGSPPTT